MKKVFSFFALCLTIVLATSCTKNDQQKLLASKQETPVAVNKNTIPIINARAISCPSAPPTVVGYAVGIQPIPGGAYIGIDLTYTNPDTTGSFKVTITTPNKSDLTQVLPIGGGNGIVRVQFSTKTYPAVYSVKVVGRSSKLTCDQSLKIITN